MRGRTVLQGILTVIGMTGLQAWADPPKASTGTMESPGASTQRPGDKSQPDLSSLIADPRALSVVHCDLENARWGNYDTRIYVKTREGKSYILDFSKGQLSIRPVMEKPAWVNWGSPEQQRDGKVVMASADEAFGKGLPFYVSAEFQPPDTLRVTVVSNPGKSIDHATLFTSWTSPAGAGSMKFSGHVRSSGEPQTLLVRAEGFKDTAAIGVWVREGEVNKSNPLVDMPHCLISNEIELKK